MHLSRATSSGPPLFLDAAAADLTTSDITHSYSLVLTIKARLQTQRLGHYLITSITARYADSLATIAIGIKASSLLWLSKPSSLLCAH